MHWRIRTLLGLTKKKPKSASPNKKPKPASPNKKRRNSSENIFYNAVNNRKKQPAPPPNLRPIWMVAKSLMKK